MQTRIILIPLFSEMVLTTNGTPVSPVFFDIPSGKVKPLLPYAVGLTLYSLTEGESGPTGNDVEWNVMVWSGYNRNHELPNSFPLVTAGTHINANGPLRHAPINVNTSFMLESRLQVMAQNRLTVAGPKTLIVGATLAVETVGM
jgi:hypothetical protein